MRVIRVLEYAGTKEWVTKTLARSTGKVNEQGGGMKELTRLNFSDGPFAFLEGATADPPPEPQGVKVVGNFPIDVPAELYDEEPVMVPDDAYWVEDRT